MMRGKESPNSVFVVSIQPVIDEDAGCYDKELT